MAGGATEAAGAIIGLVVGAIGGAILLGWAGFVLGGAIGRALEKKTYGR